jgi:hypothetical protein
MADTTFRHGDPDTIPYTPGDGDKSPGQVILLGNTTGLTCGIVPANGILNTKLGALDAGGGVYECINLNNAANYVKVYWDNSAKKVTTVTTNNALFGFVSSGGGGGANTACLVKHWPFVV